MRGGMRGRERFQRRKAGHAGRRARSRARRKRHALYSVVLFDAGAMIGSDSSTNDVEGAAAAEKRRLPPTRDADAATTRHLASIVAARVGRRQT